MDILLEKINETFFKIETNRGILQELSDYFSFFIPGYKFMPKYKAGVWDGKIRIFNVKTKLLHIGLYNELLKFAKEKSYTCSSYEPGYRSISDENFGVFIEKLKIPFKVRDYQFSSALYALNERRCGLLSPTASGKSLMIYLITRYFLAKQKNVLIIVPTTTLVKQMNSDFAEYNNGTELDTHCIMAGVDKSVQKPIVISTWQSLMRLPQEWFERFDCIIGDEAHTFQAASLVAIMDKCVNAADRFAFTGTLNGMKASELQIVANFGPFIKVTTTKELMDNGDVSQLKIKNIILKYPDHMCKAVKSLKYHEEISFINSSNERNSFIGKLVSNIPGNSLILFKHVESHGEILYKYLKEKYESEDHKIFFVSGKIDTDSREQIRKYIDSNSGHKCTIVASMGTMSTGSNMKQLQNVIFASPSKAQIKILQSIGRGLRLDGKENKMNLYDIVDDLRIKNHINYAMKHFIERVKIYGSEQFSFSSHTYNLD